MLTPTKELLKSALEGKYALGAFNFVNMEVLEGIIAGAEEANTPIIVAITEGAIRYARLDVLAQMAHTLISKAKIPIALHLDHGRSLSVIIEAIKAGFTSVMIDASDKPFEENVAITRKVVEIAHSVNVSVEAELGRLEGIEDNIESKEKILVNPKKAREFVIKTKVDFLAPAVGTSHGAYKFKGEPRIEIDLIEEVAKLTHIPLVLHGASEVPEYLVNEINTWGGKVKGAKGLPIHELHIAIKAGIAKVNTDTDLRLAFTAGIRKALGENPEVFDLRKILGAGREMVKQEVKRRCKALIPD